ncbi:MAG: hypothetical protein JWP04_2235 [Belnapia sp.]|nr:hypothetical protein [Belnapia sp.]
MAAGALGAGGKVSGPGPGGSLQWGRRAGPSSFQAPAAIGRGCGADRFR